MTGKDLKNKLELTGIPFRQIAEALNISEQNLQNKMSSADIKVSFLCKISKRLHKSIYYFLDGQDFYKETDEENRQSITPIATSSDTITLRLMDKLDEKDIKIDQLQNELRLMSEELGKLKAQHSQSQNKESEHHSIVDKITETFTSESSGDYGEGSLLTKQPTTSKRSSAGKT